MSYLILILEFMKIGLFAVGGGNAAIPFLMELIDKYHWYTEFEFTNLIAISQSTPGPVGVNMATYSGYLAAGYLGAILATLALVFPSVVIIILVVKVWDKFQESTVITSIFEQLRPAVTGLIATSAFGIIRMALFETDGSKSVFQTNVFVLFLIIFAFMQLKRLRPLHPGIWMLVAALTGILFF